MIDLTMLTLEIATLINFAEWFPVDTGLMRDSTEVIVFNSKKSMIHFTRYETPEVVHYLETGTRPHDIPNAFGKGEEFGIGGRFDGMFHPGSTKHVGFISRDAVNLAIEHICEKYDGELR